MNLFFKTLKIIYLLLEGFMSFGANVLKFCLDVIATPDIDNEDIPSKSIYMLDEQGNEIIDDGVTFGYELDNPFKYRNRP